MIHNLVCAQTISTSTHQHLDFGVKRTTEGVILVIETGTTAAEEVTEPKSKVVKDKGNGGDGNNNKNNKFFHVFITEALVVCSKVLDDDKDDGGKKKPRDSSKSTDPPSSFTTTVTSVEPPTTIVVPSVTLTSTLITTTEISTTTAQTEGSTTPGTSVTISVTTSVPASSSSPAVTSPTISVTPTTVLPTPPAASTSPGNSGAISSSELSTGAKAGIASRPWFFPATRPTKPDTNAFYSRSSLCVRSYSWGSLSLLAARSVPHGKVRRYTATEHRGPGRRRNGPSGEATEGARARPTPRRGEHGTRIARRRLHQPRQPLRQTCWSHPLRRFRDPRRTRGGP